MHVAGCAQPLTLTATAAPSHPVPSSTYLTSHSNHDARQVSFPTSHPMPASFVFIFSHADPESIRSLILILHASVVLHVRH
ncbi:hypothetical protein LX36DRAFT_102588 [Colletotrichum falcatum]|nr:hypothetical protein LX36DRAFT_102588 [Colletotrichum falcatum]